MAKKPTTKELLADLSARVVALESATNNIREMAALGGAGVTILWKCYSCAHRWTSDDKTSCPNCEASGSNVLVEGLVGRAA